MTLSKKNNGQAAEEAAYLFLQKKGLTLLSKNYRSYVGEIDLVMKDQETIVFIEVRLRSKTQFGNAIESITPRKVKRIVQTATRFLQERKWLYTVACRFDIIAIHPIHGIMQLEWIQNAFTSDK